MAYGTETRQFIPHIAGAPEILGSYYRESNDYDGTKRILVGNSLTDRLMHFSSWYDPDKTPRWMQIAADEAATQQRLANNIRRLYYAETPFRRGLKAIAIVPGKVPSHASLTFKVEEKFYMSTNHYYSENSDETMFVCYDASEYDPRDY